MFAWDATRFVDLTGVMRGAAEVGAVAPTVTILTFEEWFALLYVVLIAVAPGAMEGVVAGTVGPGVVEVIAGVVDLVVGHVGEGWRAVDDARGDAVVGVSIRKCLGAFEALLCDVFEVRS